MSKKNAAAKNGGQMSQVNVTVNGASRDAVFIWDGKKKPLVGGGGASYATSFNATKGSHVYCVVVFGNPGDAWTASIGSGPVTQNHAGHMSPSGFDTTRDTPFKVS